VRSQGSGYLIRRCAVWTQERARVGSATSLSLSSIGESLFRTDTDWRSTLALDRRGDDIAVIQRSRVILSSVTYSLGRKEEGTVTSTDVPRWWSEMVEGPSVISPKCSTYLSLVASSIELAEIVQCDCDSVFVGRITLYLCIRLEDGHSALSALG
jgi:hypothetical protein